MGTHTHTSGGSGGHEPPQRLTAAPPQAWRRYDTDRSGYIEANELKVGCGHGLGPYQWDIPAGTAGDGDSQQNPFLPGLLVGPAEEGEPALRRAQAAGVHTDHRKWDLGHCVPSGSHQPRRVACRGGGVMGDRVLFVSQQLRMFDMNGDGKLGLSEMSR